MISAKVRIARRGFGGGPRTQQRSVSTDPDLSLLTAQKNLFAISSSIAEEAAPGSKTWEDNNETSSYWERPRLRPGCYDIGPEIWIGWFGLVPQII